MFIIYTNIFCSEKNSKKNINAARIAWRCVEISVVELFYLPTYNVLCFIGSKSIDVCHDEFVVFYT